MLGELIEIKRKRKGWSKRELARRVGCTDVAVWKWETNRSVPRVHMIVRLCSHLDLDVEEAFREVE